MNHFCFQVLRNNNDMDVIHTVDKTMENLVKVFPSEVYFQKLLSLLRPNEKSSIILSSLRIFQKIIPLLDWPAVEYSLPILMPYLVSSICHSSLAMRKAAVFVVVEMYFIAGEALLDHLKDLNAAQMKLITIYINRNEKASKTVSLAHKELSDCLA